MQQQNHDKDCQYVLAFVIYFAYKTLTKGYKLKAKSITLWYLECKQSTISNVKGISLVM